MSTPLPGRLLVALGAEGGVRVLAVVVDGPADEVRARHGLGPEAAVLAAEGLVAALLLSAHIKGEERLTLDVRAETPALSFTADVDAAGTLRARFSPPDLPPGRRIDGVLSVMKSLGPQTLYRGYAAIRDEGFEGALQRYLDESQQADSRVRVQAEVDAEGRVRFAAGLLVERLPHLPREVFAATTAAALQGGFPELMTAFAFGQLAGSRLEVLGAQDFVFRCSCSRERVRATLRALGAAEIRSLIAEQGGAEVTCHYCNEVYRLDAAELEELLSALPGPAPAEA